MQGLWFRENREPEKKVARHFLTGVFGGRIRCPQTVARGETPRARYRGESHCDERRGH
jgi:hypothetical protein